MKLLTYLQQNGISDEDFGSRVSASESAVRKWKYGERMPRAAVLLLIRRETNGAVMPNDFFPEPEMEALAL